MIARIPDREYGTSWWNTSRDMSQPHRNRYTPNDARNVVLIPFRPILSFQELIRAFQGRDVCQPQLLYQPGSKSTCNARTSDLTHETWSSFHSGQYSLSRNSFALSRVEMCASLSCFTSRAPNPHATPVHPI